MSTDPRLAEWLSAARDAVAASTFAKLSLNKPTESAGDLKSIDARPLVIKGELKLSFTYHHKTNDIVKNYTVDEAMAMVTAFLSDKFANGRLFTLEADLQLTSQGTGHALHRHPPTETKAPQLDHNRAKNRIVGGGAGWMRALGLADARGDILPTAQDKYRQINKYIEILDNLIKQLPPERLDEFRPLKIIDMGAGKGYLTFALYDHITNKMNLAAEIIGVEFRADLVKLCNQVAFCSNFSSLNFVEGTIEGFDCTGADIVIALHACDTATDDAIAKAINADAALIVVAPCCHKQIRREMEKGNGKSDLDFLLKYGTYVERIAEMVTDGMRGEMMELSGYKTNLFEFISDTHTPKNVMIVASKQSVSDKKAAALRVSLDRTKTQFGIGIHYLEGLLGR